jgi:hypothetical protein
MANHALVIGWNRAVTGREARALEGFQRSIAFWTKQIKDGNVESFEPFLLTPHGGDLNGFILVKGDRDKLNAVRWSEEFQDIQYDAMQYLDGLGVSDALAGDAIGPARMLYAKHATP